MFPRFIERVHFAPEDFHTASLSKRLHFFKALFLLLVRLRIFVTHHQDKIIKLKTHQAHRKRSFFRALFTQTSLAVTYKLQKWTRCKPGVFCKFAPRKRGATLTFLVVLQNVLAIVLVFNNRFHHNINLLNRMYTSKVPRLFSKNKNGVFKQISAIIN